MGSTKNTSVFDVRTVLSWFWKTVLELVSENNRNIWKNNSMEPPPCGVLFKSQMQDREVEFSRRCETTLANKRRDYSRGPRWNTLRNYWRERGVEQFIVHRPWRKFQRHCLKSRNRPGPFEFVIKIDHRKENLGLEIVRRFFQRNWGTPKRRKRSTVLFYWS